MEMIFCEHGMPVTPLTPCRNCIHRRLTQERIRIATERMSDEELDLLIAHIKARADELKKGRA